MAVSYVGSIGGSISKTSSNVISNVTGVTIPIGRLIVAFAVSDNLSATTPTFTFSDSKSNTWTTVSQNATNATAAAGVAAAIGVCYVTTQIASTDSITVTLSGTVAIRGLYSFQYSGARETEYVADVVAAGSSTTPSVISNSIGAAGQLVVGLVGFEHDTAGTQDTDTSNGTWVNLVNLANAAGNAFTNVGLIGAHKIVTGTGTQTYNPTLNTATDWVALVAVLSEDTGTSASLTTTTFSTSVTLPAVATSVGATASPATISAATTMPAVSAKISMTALPGTILTTTTTPQPNLTIGGTRSVTTISTSATLPAPTLSSGATQSTTTISTTATLPDPTVQIIEALSEPTIGVGPIGTFAFGKPEPVTKLYGVWGIRTTIQ